mmetsp:Transcript_1811/g.11056  ORF Transcript_1811/g.11056 Transcript_1811/m.11056 type:complete len:125 (+) Transcript_1811:412-786(+)|eukprot:CAMPEP_0183827522 /NCGR_PEP_ID=MMETSP0807_2-20130328/2291_1 /TAXON_ID=88271 /ORGANISM="Picocystis salinarum, Strain CCMP1897" /LENGTH=124 /DNA_ID=CAMNT_0026072683 /DNA_START=298 /DNA_END=672 /DNA_ORIENTATION=+
MSQGMSSGRGETMVPPVGPVSTDTIQKYLDENQALIIAIVENQNLGKLNECAQYQARLQQNLMYLAAIADAQPQTGATTGPHQSNPNQMSTQFMRQQQQYNVLQNQHLHGPSAGGQFSGPGTYR